MSMHAPQAPEAVLSQEVKGLVPKASQDVARMCADVFAACANVRVFLAERGEGDTGKDASDLLAVLDDVGAKTLSAAEVSRSNEDPAVLLQRLDYLRPHVAAVRDGIMEMSTAVRVRIDTIETLARKVERMQEALAREEEKLARVKDRPASVAAKGTKGRDAQLAEQQEARDRAAQNADQASLRHDKLRMQSPKDMPVREGENGLTLAAAAESVRERAAMADPDLAPIVDACEYFADRYRAILERIEKDGMQARERSAADYRKEITAHIDATIDPSLAVFRDALAKTNADKERDPGLVAPARFLGHLGDTYSKKLREGSTLKDMSEQIAKTVILLDERFGESMDALAILEMEAAAEFEECVRLTEEMEQARPGLIKEVIGAVATSDQYQVAQSAGTKPAIFHHHKKTLKKLLKDSERATELDVRRERARLRMNNLRAVRYGLMLSRPGATALRWIKSWIPKRVTS